MEEFKTLTLENLGYSPFFERGRKQLGLDKFPVARVTAEHRGEYEVKNVEGEYRAKLTGKEAFSALSREDYPAVGDWVAIEVLNIEQAVIRGTLPRQTVLKRRRGDRSRLGNKDMVQIIAANIDVAFIIEAVDRDYNLNRFERYISIAKEGGVTPLVILNKVDLISKEELEEMIQEFQKRFPTTAVLTTSIEDEGGLSTVRECLLKGKTYCFLGSSGVGKSSLINKLLGEDTIKVGDISSFSGRGRHTTTSRQMYFLENGEIVIDNPGIREVGVADDGQTLDLIFEEIQELAKQCKYSDCTHQHEPGCAVMDSVETGLLDRNQYINYLNLRKEADYSDMSKVEKRHRNHNFAKFKKKVLKDLKESDSL